jgi:hypothetical protein
MPTFLTHASTGIVRQLPRVREPIGPFFHLSSPSPPMHEPQGTFLLPSWEYILLDDLSHDFYQLNNQITIEVEYTSDIVIARYNPIEMYGEGGTRDEAINDLQASIIAYYECLLDVTEERLGPLPYKHWQKLNSLVSRRS